MLNNSNNNNNNNINYNDDDNDDTSLDKIRGDTTGKNSKDDIRNQLNNSSVKDLLIVIREAQEDRVAVYRKFDSALQEVLVTGNVTNYPLMCAEVTAQFTVLSDTINMAREFIKKREPTRSLGQIIDDLQSNERNKLNLTAALHLEQIRVKVEGPTATENIRQLLEQSVSDLKIKISDCESVVNEVLEELRYAIIDESSS